MGCTMAADRLIVSGDAHPMIIEASQVPQRVLFGLDPAPQESWILDDVMGCPASGRLAEMQPAT